MNSLHKKARDVANADYVLSQIDTLVTSKTSVMNKVNLECTRDVKRKAPKSKT